MTLVPVAMRCPGAESMGGRSMRLRWTNSFLLPRPTVTPAACPDLGGMTKARIAA